MRVEIEAVEVRLIDDPVSAIEPDGADAADFEGYVRLRRLRKTRSGRHDAFGSLIDTLIESSTDRCEHRVTRTVPIQRQEHDPRHEWRIEDPTHPSLRFRRRKRGRPFPAANDAVDGGLRVHTIDAVTNGSGFA